MLDLLAVFYVEPLGVKDPLSDSGRVKLSIHLAYGNRFRGGGCFRDPGSVTSGQALLLEITSSFALMYDDLSPRG